MEDNQNKSDIRLFFKNKSVFLTGATGFLGKVILEKLLRSCPDIGSVYILLRPKKGHDLESRVAALLETPVYDSIRHDNPDALLKIIPIPGDVSLPDMGIAEQDQVTLASHVSVVIHSAATVKFDEDLKVAVNINAGGTKRILKLCKEMKRLEAFVHVSTAYSNCEYEDIRECVYSTAVDPLKAIGAIEWLNEDAVAATTTYFVGKKPNTYTFSKALAEQLLNDEGGDLPICIIRPSIISASLKEPLVGWVDNMSGATGIFTGIANGVLRTLLCHGNKVADLIPVDLTANLIIAAAWSTATSKSKKLTVYNCCSGSINPLRWNDVKLFLLRSVRSHAFSTAVWYPSINFDRYRLIHSLNDFILQYVPFVVMDVVAMIGGKKSRMMKLYHKIKRMTSVVEYFTTHEWSFQCDNVVDLRKRMAVMDRDEFRIDAAEIDWRNYLNEYMLGVRKYVMKEDPRTLPAARQRMKRYEGGAVETSSHRTDAGDLRG